MRDVLMWLAAWETGAREATHRAHDGDRDLPPAYYALLNQHTVSAEALVQLDGWREGWFAGTAAPFEAF